MEKQNLQNRYWYAYGIIDGVKVILGDFPTADIAYTEGFERFKGDFKVRGFVYKNRAIPSIKYEMLELTDDIHFTMARSKRK
jgi:hypothetical protein